MVKLQTLISIFIWGTILLLTGVLVWILLPYLLEDEAREAIHIAFGGTIEGEGAISGNEALKGAQLYINQANQAGPINGKRLELEISDQHKTRDAAEDLALEIVDKPIVGVIGHSFSTGSLAAGAVYRQMEIPAIAPTSTNVEVTMDNDWYFRTIFNDRVQGQILANYVVRVLETPEINIIHHPESYGSYLAEIFQQTAQQIGATVVFTQSWSEDEDDFDLPTFFQEIVANLKLEGNQHPIFLAVSLEEAIAFIKIFRDQDLENLIITPDSLASANFSQGFNEYPEEINEPGYYTNGIYTTIPFNFSTGGEMARQFVIDYRQAYEGETPTWRAAFAYDAAKLLVEAIRATEVTGDVENLRQDRRKIRDYLASRSTPEKAIEGVTGFTYFDESGDPFNLFSIGVYQNRNLLPASVQVKVVPEGEVMDSQKAFTIENRTLLPINIVYTGIQVNQISQLDFEESTYHLDFNLWFRFQADIISPEDIVFLNEAEPIQSLDPIAEVDNNFDHVHYLAYQGHGKFKADFLANYHTFDQHILGLQFRHQNETENSLIYVPDESDLTLLSRENIPDGFRDALTFNQNLDWRVDDDSPGFFQDYVRRNTLGNPEYINEGDFSRFNYAILVKKDRYPLVNLIPSRFILPLFMFGLTSLTLVILLDWLVRFLDRFNLLFWFLEGILITFMFMITEKFALDWFASQLQSYNVGSGQVILATVTLGAAVLHWLIPAALLKLLIARFAWRPLTRAVQHAVPMILVRLIDFTILATTTACIIAFVFEQPVPSLLLGFSVIILVVGIALQINMSKLFASFIVNAEHDIRLGNWISINDFEEGRVVDTNWWTTKIRTRTNTLISLPNSRVAELAVQNFDSSEVTQLSMQLHIDPEHAPTQVKVILQEALSSVTEVLKTPKPNIYVTKIDPWGTLYTITYAIQSYANKESIADEVWEQIWTYLKEAGFRFALPRQEVYTQQTRLSPRRLSRG